MTSRFPRVRSYELMIIFHPEMEDEELGQQVDRVRSYITDVTGSITVLNRESPWGRRRLAYPIRHESRDLRDGIYALYYFDIEANRTVEIEREIKLNTRIIRHMLIQQSTPTMEPPAPVEQAPPSPDGAAAPNQGPAIASEASPGTPPEATPTPAEPIIPESAGPPAAAEENISSPTLDSSSEPSLPSQTLPPADESLVEVARAAEGEAEPTTLDDDLPMHDAPPESADVAETSDTGAATADAGVATASDDDESTPTPAV